VASAAGMDHNLPNQIEIAGEKYVVWKTPASFDSKDKTGSWNVMKDVCSHRYAPLSQGRIDKLSGCIECPYHGWQFDKKGACTKIPQVDSGKSIPSAADVTSFPVKVMGDIIFSFLPLPGKYANYFSISPEEAFPMISKLAPFYVRELPYSFDFLLENFMDPAHVPFAHHSLQSSILKTKNILQSTRDDGRSTPMELLSSLDDGNQLEISFKDTSGGVYRDAVMSFTVPCYFHFRDTRNSSTKAKPKAPAPICELLFL